LSNNGYETVNVEIKQTIEPEHIGVTLSEDLQLHPKQYFNT
jgi:hypothetical protein